MSTELDPWLKLVLAVLATWRITHLLAHEDGPFDLVFRLRKHMADSWVGRLMDCFHCLSLWIAAPLAAWITQSPLEWLITWIALSGAACLLERTHDEPVIIRPMPEDTKGEDSGMLRPESKLDDERGQDRNERNATASSGTHPASEHGGVDPASEHRGAGRSEDRRAE